MTHYLKTWPNYFNAVWDGDKTFEIRNDSDRGFQKGDIAILMEFDPEPIGKTESKRYSGRQIRVSITYVTAFKQIDGFVVFGFKIQSKA